MVKVDSLSIDGWSLLEDEASEIAYLVLSLYIIRKVLLQLSSLELSLLPKQYQQNVKTPSGPPRGVMVPLVLLVHPNPPWSTFSVKFEKVWIRVDQSGSGVPRGPRLPFVDEEHSGPLWTTLRHFPDVVEKVIGKLHTNCTNFIILSLQT